MSDPIDRLIDAAESGKSIIKNRNVLQTSYVPNIIQHRDEEAEIVTQSLLPILKQSRPSNLLVYGKPGTGKTLVVKKILSKFQKKVEKSNFPIKLLYSNSIEESSLSGFLVSLGRQLGLTMKELPTTGLSHDEVFNRILRKIDEEKLNAVFVIDEIDNLADLVAKSGKDILYKLTRANDRLKQGSLTLVGISNTLNFKEKLDPRVISSLGEEEIVFTNYNQPQIKKILEERINEAFVDNSIDEGTLNYIAAKQSKVSGDARRAIALLRVAGEIAERQQSDKVKEKHVDEAAKKIEEDKEDTTLKSYTLHERLVMVAIIKANGSSTGEIYSTYKNLCKITRQEELTSRRITQMLSEIELDGLITGRIIHQGTHGRTKKHTLGTSITPKKIKKIYEKDLTLKDII